jgi:N-methylhydantoinase A/oxoprolinase/acetone carboxylase beta subunit
MKSDGGFDKSNNVKSSQLLLSGPAGGLIGCKSIINVFEDCISAPVNSK